MPKISIIIPALNEEDNLGILIEELSSFVRSENLDVEILIVDDCSTDITLAVAEQLGRKYKEVKAIHKGLPRGIGRAIRCGIANAQGKMAVVIMADNTVPLELIPQFRRKIMDEGYKLVLFSRYLNPEDSRVNIPFKYRFFHWGYRFLVRYLLGIKFKDTTCAIRAFDLNFVKGLNLESAGFEISPEITFKVWFNKGRIAEIGGSQGRRLKGVSHFSFSKAGIGFPRVVFKAFIMRISGRWPKARTS